MSIPVASRFLGLWVRIPPWAQMTVSCVCCVLSGRGLCDEPIIRPEESYREWCVWACSWRLDNEVALAPWGVGGCCAQGKKMCIHLSCSLGHVSARNYTHHRVVLNLQKNWCKRSLPYIKIQVCNFVIVPNNVIIKFLPIQLLKQTGCSVLATCEMSVPVTPPRNGLSRDPRTCYTIQTNKMTFYKLIFFNF